VRILGKSFTERNPITIAVVSIVVVVALLAAGFQFRSIVSHFTENGYSADFTDVAGLGGGEDVQISGVTVGSVGGITLQHGHVKVDFKLKKGVHLGTDTRASISTATVLGKKVLKLTPAGPGRLKAGSEIPISRTSAPYDITDVLSQLSTTTTEVNTTQLAASLTTLSQAFANAPDDVKSALSGVSRLSETIASRDAALRALLSNANGVTQILSDRKAQFVTLFQDGNLLLQELYSQRDAIHTVLISVTRVVNQLDGLVADNKTTLKPALTQLEGALDLLNKHQSDLVAAITGLKRYATGLGEAVGGGPFFYAFIPNLPPTDLAIPNGVSLAGVPVIGSLVDGLLGSLQKANP